MTPLEAKARMLRLWSALSDASSSPVTIVTTDNIAVRAASLVPNNSQSLFAVTQLETPLGTYPSAVLRAHEVSQIDATISPQQLQKLLSKETTAHSKMTYR